MSEPNTDQMVEQLGNLTAPQLVALTKQLEAKWGVSAAPSVVNMVAPPAPPPVVAQTEFNVTLVSFGTDKKISVIKALRDVLGLGLNEAKAFAEGAPKLVKEGVAKQDADEVAGKLTTAGAVVTIE
jgi:large subunit ribosomal protein L7/L12